MNWRRHFLGLLAVWVSAGAWCATTPAFPPGPSPSTTPAARTELLHVAEPPELKDMPTPTPTPPSAVDVALAQSHLLQKFDPDHPATLQPALKELQGFIQQDPTRSDLYLLRANLSCFAHGERAAMLADLKKSIDLSDAHHSAFNNLAGHYALRAKINLEAGDGTEAMADLDRALKEDYDTASDAFNDGKVDPTTVPKPCVWTLADLDTLGKRFPTDPRPALYRGLYLTQFSHYHFGYDFKPVLVAFEKAGALDQKSALPHFYIGRLYVLGGLGGIMSQAQSKCLEYVVPRSPDCSAVDGLRETGVQELTAAIALDPTFTDAYTDRAEGLLKLKRYRQAIRDYSKALKLEKRPDERRTLLNDRALAKTNLGLHAEAIEDLTAAIKIGCAGNDSTCDQYEHRADAFAAVGNYARAIDDVSLAIRGHLDVAFLMGIRQFRRVYPEYDAVSDDVLCDLMRRRLHPGMSYADFAGQFLLKAKGFDSSVIADLYVKRGDWYQKAGQHRKAQQDYDRMINGFPTLATTAFTQVNGRWVRNAD